MKMLAGLLLVLVALALLAIAAGQFGLLGGKAPQDLGVREGKLKAPSLTPNSVTSQAELWPTHPGQAYARIAPLALAGDGAAAMRKLAAIVGTMPGAVVVSTTDDYLYARFTTRWMRFTDDTEFWLDRTAGVIQVRSASRVGRGDMGANRKRIEAIRASLAAS